MSWTVTASRAVRKGWGGLPQRVRDKAVLLLREIEESGPVRGNWPNYSRLGVGRHHCHLKKGKPTYVAVWEERAGEIRLVEVTYVGTHEGAPY